MAKDKKFITSNFNLFIGLAPFARLSTMQVLPAILIGSVRFFTPTLLDKKVWYLLDDDVRNNL